jgi:hypothetical protein
VAAIKIFPVIILLAATNNIPRGDFIPIAAAHNGATARIVRTLPCLIMDIASVDEMQARRRCSCVDSLDLDRVTHSRKAPLTSSPAPAANAGTGAQSAALLVLCKQTNRMLQ